jgi:hypothetical protein
LGDHIGEESIPNLVHRDGRFLCFPVHFGQLHEIDSGTQIAGGLWENKKVPGKYPVEEVLHLLR